MPFLKWVGGKGAIAEQILERLPEHIEDYCEPFLGGGSILEALLESGSLRGRVVVGDLNRKLIDTYLAVKNDVEQLIADLETVSADVTEEGYYKARTLFNTAPTPALFIYLNKVGFRGLYRENASGVFNVPYGHYKNPTVFDAGYLRRLSGLYNAHKVSFVCTTWQETVKSLTKKSVVYLDPPYVKLLATTFTEYSAGGFGDAASNDLINWMKTSEAFILYSNHATTEMVGLLQGWNVHTFEARRAIHSKDPSSTAAEILASNKRKSIA